MSEREKMLRGELYLASDPELVAMRLHTRLVLERFNTSSVSDLDARAELLAELFHARYPGVFIEPPFYCDYGQFIHLGRNVFMNFGCTILDICHVRIGDNTLLAPNVQIYAASHPFEPAVRRQGLECGAPVTIGSDCWIGGNSVIVPGVTIGDGTTIGAGSVVSKDIPAGVLAAGNPCRVIRSLPSR